VVSGRGLFAASLVVLGMIPDGAAAEVEQRFRIQGTWSSPTDRFRESDVDGDVVIEAEDAFGGRFAYEVLFADRWGAELAAGTARHDVSVEAEGAFFPSSGFDLGTIRVTPITASLLYHFDPHGKADFFFGGGAAWVDYGDFQLHGTFVDPDDDDSFPVDPDLTYTLQAGIDLRLGDRWGLTGNVQWTDTDAELDDADDGETLPISPIVVGGGVALRF
jgi:outer membrane protein W